MWMYSENAPLSEGCFELLNIEWCVTVTVISIKKVCILIFRGDAEISINALTLSVITQL